MRLDITHGHVSKTILKREQKDCRGRGCGGPGWSSVCWTWQRYCIQEFRASGVACTRPVQDLQKSKSDCVGEAHKPPPLTEGLVVVDRRQLPGMGESGFSGSVTPDRLITPCVHGQHYWGLVNCERDREKKREGRDMKLGEPGENWSRESEWIWPKYIVHMYKILKSYIK